MSKGLLDYFRRASRPATRRPLLKKGSIRKLFCGRATHFLWKGEESGMPEPLIFGNRSMDTVRHPFSDAFRRVPALHPATPFEKGVDPKTFVRTDNILSMEELRTRNTRAVDFWVPVYGYRSPSPLWVFCAFVHGGRHLPKALGFSAMPPACTT